MQFIISQSSDNGFSLFEKDITTVSVSLLFLNFLLCVDNQPLLLKSSTVLLKALFKGLKMQTLLRMAFLQAYGTINANA